MTEHELLEHIFDRLCHSDFGGAIFGAEDAREWPDSALDVLIKAKLLRPAEPARVIECDGCERNCFMPVSFRAAESGRSARAFISCDKPEDVGRIAVEFSRLKRWQITRAMLADVVARLLGLTKPPQPEDAGERWVLGRMRGKETKGPVLLAFEHGVTIALDGQSIPLVHTLKLNKRGLRADKSMLLQLVDADKQQPKSGVGSVEWRRQTAQAAANARHNRPGGSRDKQQQIREIWAVGNYSSRDICAEQECAELGMSFSAARKALKNAPKPKRPS